LTVVSRTTYCQGDPLFLGSAAFLFGLLPVIKFRAGLIASQDVEFVNSALDSFFEGQRFDWGCLARAGAGMG